MIDVGGDGSHSGAYAPVRAHPSAAPPAGYRMGRFQSPIADFRDSKTGGDLVCADGTEAYRYPLMGQATLQFTSYVPATPLQEPNS